MINPKLQEVLDKIGRLDIRARYGVFVVLLLLVGCLDFFLIMNFQLKMINKLSEASKKMSEDTLRVKGDVQRLNATKKGLEDMRLKFQQVNTKIRSVNEASVIFEEISSIANQARVSIDQLSPAKEGQESLMTTTEAKYYALPIVISAHSGYSMFGRFLGKLEASNVFFMLRDLRIDSGDKETVNLNIQATLKLILVDKLTGAK